MLRIAISLLALFLAAPQPGSAQATGTIGGTVRDSSGAVVPGAKITTTNEGTNLTRTVEADDPGQYIVPQLPVGAAAERRAVSSRAILLQATSSALVPVTDSQRVADLPWAGRNELQILSQKAGVYREQRKHVRAIEGGVGHTLGVDNLNQRAGV